MKIRCNAIIVAAGTGSRMNTKEKKQFLMLNNVPIFIHTIKNISKCKYVEKIVVVTHKDNFEETKNFIKEYGCEKVSQVVIGGETRADSVKIGLSNCEKCDVVLIHDGVRPFIKEELCENCITDANTYGGAVLGVCVKDTVVVKDSSQNIEKPLQRSALIAVQTPQCFKYDVIKNAYDNYDSNLTDDTSQVIKNGGVVHITQGDYKNIKITTPEDLIVAEEYIKSLN